jgi:hypothetical protein
VCDIFNKSFALQEAADAETIYNGLDDNSYDWTAGGFNDEDGDGDDMLQGETPPQVNVLFPEHVGRLPTGSGGLYSKTVTAGAANAPTSADEPAGAEWCVFSTAAADITGRSSGSTPNNATDLNNLATQIAAGFYAWLQRSYDVTCIGLWPNAPCGYEDYQLIDLRGTILTRIATLPPNVGAHTNWCQVAALAVQLWPGPRLRAQLAGTLTAGGSVACYPREWNGSALANDSNTITVYDSIGTLTGSSGDNGVAEWNPDAARWEFLELPQAGASAYGSLWGGATSPPSDGATMEFAHADAGGSGVAASASTGKITITAVGKWRIRATVEFQGTPTGVDFSFLCPSFDLYQDGNAINKDANGAVWSAGALVISGLGSGVNPYASSLGTAATATLEWEITTTTTTATSLWLVVHLPNDGGSPPGASSAHGNASLMVEQIA